MDNIRSVEYVIEWSGTTVAGGTSYSLEINSEEIDVSTLDSGEWKKVISGLKSWSGSLDGLVQRGDSSTFFALVEQLTTAGNATATLAFRATGTGNKFLIGSALLTNISKSGSGAGGQEIVTWSASFTGNGALELETV